MLDTVHGPCPPAGKLRKTTSQPLDGLPTATAGAAAAVKVLSGPLIKHGEDHGSARKDASADSVIHHHSHSLFANGGHSPRLPAAEPSGDFDLVLDFGDDFMTHMGAAGGSGGSGSGGGSGGAAAAAAADKGHHARAAGLADEAMTLPLLDSVAKDEARRQQR